MPLNTTQNLGLSTGCFFDSGFYDLALIQSFFWNNLDWKDIFPQYHQRIFKNIKTLLIGQI